MVFLTGSNGFIGRNVLKTLKEQVICTDLKTDNVFDTLDTTDWSKITKIIHLGAISDTTCSDVEFIHKYNVSYSLALFEKAIKYQIPITYASSASVYGNHWPNINPLNYYAFSKSLIDLYVEDNIHKFKNIVGLRYFNVYGRDEHKGNQSSPVFKFTQDVLAGKPIKLFEESDSIYRDFVSVDDVVKITLSEHESGIYDVGTSFQTSFQKVAELIIEKYGGTIEYIPFPSHLVGKYQYSTKAYSHFNYKFLTVCEWLNNVT